MNPDDPKLTAYSLDELSEVERRLVKEQIQNSPEAQTFVAETRELAFTLKRAYQKERDSTREEPSNVLPLPYARLFWAERRWPTFAIAALLIGSLVIAGVVIWRTAPSTTHLASNAANDSSDAVTVEYGRDDEAATVAGSVGEYEAPFISVSEKPISTFPMQVGRNSYPALRKQIEAGIRPGKETVRVEEMINYFTYSYPDAPPGHSAAVTIDAALCPWADGHLVVRIGVNIRNGSVDAFSAERVADLLRRSQVEVQFNPARIQSYRILGYDAPPAQGTGTGPTHSVPVPEARRNVTTLYEVILVNGDQMASTDSKELLRARIRSDSQAGDVAAEHGLTENPTRFEDAPTDFRFAAAVAEFGMILRESRYRGSVTLPAVIQWAEAAKGEDREGERMAFVQCARRAQSLL